MKRRNPSRQRKPETEACRVTLFERRAYARGFKRLAGIDEAGRGPLAGPVVAAAVILPRDCFIPGVRDSKKVSPAKREALMEDIAGAALSIGVGIVDHETIDRINILQATLLAARQAISSLRVEPDFLLLDALKLPDLSIAQQSIIRGDERSHLISAASVVAKVTRDRLMKQFDQIYPEYRFGSHKGYGTRQHFRALSVHGPCAIHRKTFRGVLKPIIE